MATNTLSPREVLRTLRVQAVTVAPRRPEVMGMDLQRLTHDEVHEVCRRSNAYGTLVQALRDADHALTREDKQTVRRTGAHDTVTVQTLVRVRSLLADLGEES